MYTVSQPDIFQSIIIFILLYNLHQQNRQTKKKMIDKTIGEFQVVKKLGNGAFADVFLVNRPKDGKCYALKKIHMHNLKEKERENALNELRLLASLKHESIITYKEGFIGEDKSLCMVLEYAAGGDLQKQIFSRKKNNSYFDETDIWKAIKQITLGVKFLHENKVLHRDLKSANILIDNQGNYKLGDMNVSKVMKYQLAKTQTGTPYYASPEIWRNQSYDSKSDMWSLGCIFYEMAALRPPFQAHDMSSLYKKVQACKFQKLSNQYSPELMSIISSLIKFKPSQRFSCIDLLNSEEFKLKTNTTTTITTSTTIPLLQTIKYQYNIKLMHEKLPKPHYDEDLRFEQTEQFKIEIIPAKNDNPQIHHNLKKNLDGQIERRTPPGIRISRPKQIRKSCKSTGNPSNNNMPLINTPQKSRKYTRDIGEKSTNKSQKQSNQRLKLPQIDINQN